MKSLETLFWNKVLFRTCFFKTWRFLFYSIVSSLNVGQRFIHWLWITFDGTLKQIVIRCLIPKAKIGASQRPFIQAITKRTIHINSAFSFAILLFHSYNRNLNHFYWVLFWLWWCRLKNSLLHEFILFSLYFNTHLTILRQVFLWY